MARSPGITLRAVALTLETRHPFRIARGGSSEFQTVLIALGWRGMTGYGEAASSTYVGENTGTVWAALRTLAQVLKAPGATPFAAERLLDECHARLRHNPAARAAVDMALHDLLGKALDAPVTDLWGLRGLPLPPTSLTIAIDAPEVMVAKVREAAGWGTLKIKVGFPGDVEVVQDIRRLTDQTLHVDANEGWTVREAVTRGRQLAALGVDMIEQPVPAADLEGLRFVRDHVGVPVFADEACVTSADLPRLAGVVDGINIKLAKCGGLREMRRMIDTARALQLRVMFGCMVETSVGVTAAAQLGSQADVLDLDGSTLLARDPMRGMTVECGVITLSEAPGLGVGPRDRAVGKALREAKPL